MVWQRGGGEQEGGSGREKLRLGEAWSGSEGLRELGRSLHHRGLGKSGSYGIRLICLLFIGFIGLLLIFIQSVCHSIFQLIM